MSNTLNNTKKDFHKSLTINSDQKKKLKKEDLTSKIFTVLEEFKDLQMINPEEAKSHRQTDLNNKQTKDLGKDYNNNEDTIFYLFKDTKFPDHSYKKIHSFLSLNQNKNNQLDQIITEDIMIPKDKILSTTTIDPGLFTSLDFENQIQQCLSLSLLEKHDHNDLHQKEEINEIQDFNNMNIIQMCLDQNVDLYTKDKETKKKLLNYQKSISKKHIMTYDGDNIDLRRKSEALPESENNLLVDKHMISIKKDSEGSWLAPIDEVLDVQNYNFLQQLIENENSPRLQNKLKWILKILDDKDKDTNIPFFSNKIKNKILRDWKKNYEQSYAIGYEKKKEELNLQMINKQIKKNKTLGNKKVHARKNSSNQKIK